MKNKIFLSGIAIVIAASVAGTWGYASKMRGRVNDSYGRFYENAETAGAYYTVNCFGKSSAGINSHLFDLWEQPYLILRGRHTGKRRYVADAVVQEIEIEKIVKGECKAKIGEKIEVATPDMHFDPSLCIVSGSINHMREGDSYLVCCLPFGSCANRPEGIGVDMYMTDLVHDFGYFNCRNSDDVTAEELSDGNKHRIAPYFYMKDNEFFVRDKAALERIQKTKAQIFERLGEKVENM